ncbi:nickel-dependent lactate racemase [Clostridiaceae bacterium 35-E11]
MKTIKMKYGTEVLDVFVQEKNLLGKIESNGMKKNKTEEEVIVDALAQPIDSGRLKDIVKPGEKICIIISDITRAWQKMSRYLPYIVEELNQGGIKDEDVVFLCATGTHRKQTKEEHTILLGEQLAQRFEVIDHDCRHKDSLVYIGETSYKTPVIINKMALDCDHIIVTGAVVFHDLAGWGGGRKSILPGISAYESIMANHALALNKNIGEGIHPGVRCGNGINNPIHQDMVEAANLVKPSYIFNVIMDDNGDIVKAVAGDYRKAHEIGQQLVEEIDGVAIKDKADLVIASAGGYPKDINLYQASKALSNAKEAVNNEGIIILLSQCIEGIGDPDVQEIIECYKSNIDRECSIREHFTVARYIGYMIAEIASRIQIILVSDIEPDLLEKINIQVVKTVEEALDIAYTKKGKDLKTYVMPYAANTLPKVK